MLSRVLHTEPALRVLARDRQRASLEGRLPLLLCWPLSSTFLVGLGGELGTSWALLTA